MKYLVSLFYILATLSACNSDNPKAVITHKQLKKPLLEQNKKNLKLENQQIDAFVSRMNWSMQTSGTGLRYKIYKKGYGIQATPNKVAIINFTVSLLDGTMCYASPKGKPEDFLIGEDYVERGLHEGIQYLKVGDKAKFILPTYLAHGLAGDQNKIPPMSTIVYDVELVGLR